MITQFFKPQSQARKARTAARVMSAAAVDSASEPSVFHAEYTTARAAVASGELTYANCASRLHHLVHPSWRQVLDAEFSKGYWRELVKKLEAEGKKGTSIFPSIDEVFYAFEACPLNDARVVIIGQDPYHGAGQAHGLCFSVKFGVRIPPSLRNMYKLLATDVKGFTTPTHGNLSYWAAQGVLMLNATLTVKQANANSHSKWGWQTFVDAAIAAVNKHHRNLVFMLWGGFAQKKAKFVDKKKQHILKSAHPSPLSARRGWFDCAHFSKCNEFLVGRGLKKVDWKLPQSADELSEKLQKLKEQQKVEAAEEHETETEATVVGDAEDATE